jgi:C-terminal processing protease CtpA/Prc
MAKSFGLNTTEGALLSSINPGSAAEKAGLKPGDIVLSLNGEKVTNSSDLVAKLYTFEPGQTVQMTILRNNGQIEIPVTLQKLDETALKPGANDQGNEGALNGSTAQNEDIGAIFQDQSPDIRSQLPSDAPKGPVVT